MNRAGSIYSSWGPTLINLNPGSVFETLISTSTNWESWWQLTLMSPYARCTTGMNALSLVACSLEWSSQDLGEDRHVRQSELSSATTLANPLTWLLKEFLGEIMWDHAPSAQLACNPHPILGGEFLFLPLTGNYNYDTRKMPDI